MLKKKKLSIVTFAIIILIMALIYTLNTTRSKKQIKDLTENLFEHIQSELVSINKYIVYGTHLNIEGKLETNLTNSNIDEVKLVLKDISGIEMTFEVKYSIDKNGITFNTSDEINSGINLEEILQGEYYMLLEIVSSLDGIKSDNYYFLNNKTEYENIEYYTITKNNKNNKINISSNEYLLNGIVVNYMDLTVKEAKLPDNIYDIVIDPRTWWKRSWCC